MILLGAVTLLQMPLIKVFLSMETANPVEKSVCGVICMGHGTTGQVQEGIGIELMRYDRCEYPQRQIW